ncbi:MAG: hypothetical protein AABW59_04085 [archaeon]
MNIKIDGSVLMLGIAAVALILTFAFLATNTSGTAVQQSGGTTAQGVSAADLASADAGAFRIQVQIPCAGHTGLILREVGKMNGVVSVKTSGGWNSFEVIYDKTKTTKEAILASDLFKSYPAREI